MPATAAITNLLKAHDAGVSAVKANKALLAMGILEQKERPSSKYPDKIKKYKALTEEGLKYGENRESMTSDETTPYYFCLLYTSPSPRDQRGSRMPSSA